MAIHPALVAAILSRPRDEVVLFRLAANETYEDAVSGGVDRLVGWIKESREFGVTIGELQALVGLPTEQPTPTPIPVAKLYKVIPPNNLNVRSAASVASEKVGRLAPGSLVWIGVVQGEWGRISEGVYAGKWINMKFVRGA
jgi:uncharacterized protein YgiM (DUF1202 family)